MPRRTLPGRCRRRRLISGLDAARRHGARRRARVRSARAADQVPQGAKNERNVAVVSLRAALGAFRRLRLAVSLLLVFTLTGGESLTTRAGVRCHGPTPAALPLQAWNDISYYINENRPNDDDDMDESEDEAGASTSKKRRRVPFNEVSFLSFPQFAVRFGRVWALVWGEGPRSLGLL